VAAISRIAREAIEVLGAERQIVPFSMREASFELADAYRVAAVVKAMREARGERAIGRKIGFTNRTIWDQYDVHAPIWGYIYDTTVADLPRPGETASLTGLAEPRIEPEIIFGLMRRPAPNMGAAALASCLDWVAHGFEVVQSIFPGWIFSPADTIAGYGLHGRLWIGPRHGFAQRASTFLKELTTFEIDLIEGGVQRDHGRAADVLDGPLFALLHLVKVLSVDEANPPLEAGEIVTTGTLTRAFPASSGQSWRTRLHGLPLEDAEIAFA